MSNIVHFYYQNKLNEILKSVFKIIADIHVLSKNLNKFRLKTLNFNHINCSK